MSNPLYLAAGALSLMAAGIHGAVGERLVVARLERTSLPATPWGGPAVSHLLIRVTWHIVTLAFAASGVALATCAWTSIGPACSGAARLVAASFGAFFLLSVGLAAVRRRDMRILARHPAPLIFAAVAILAWKGSL